MSEWLMEHAWKACVGVNLLPWVRIPLSPPFFCTRRDERIGRFPLTRITLLTVGILAALWLLRLLAGGIGRGLGAWWPGGVANVVLPVLAVHFAYRGITRLLEGCSAAELSLHGAAASDTFFAKKPRTPLHPKPDCAIMGVRGSIAERLGGVR